MSDDLPKLTDDEETALHELELGVEGLRKAHGYLVHFHHATGRAMNHLQVAESNLREAGHDEFADHIRDEILPSGVLGDDRWTYELLETFEEEFFEHVVTFEQAVCENVASGERHVKERRQQRRWRERARD
ncbi:hypothetical protein SAMN05421858_0197 [Haladaptatus litoreus]|uniref:Uncharacterized protein n=1 Tax=Haladaptatus litoreus TaxID=553468 RepID=A0A1N6V3I0_9EURY|nr:hypothetical protein [Haladaptatus litoreus]SIQ72358.1 hypothetical protein SAMN05421858_0197 [Haladaptatus litoreus]